MSQPRSKTTASKTTCPKHWPADIGFLRSPKYSTSLPQSARDALCQPTASLKPDDDRVLQNLQSPSPLVHIDRIAKSQHPAHGQYGLFASRHLTPGTPIISYVGIVHDQLGADPSSNYDLSLDRERGVAVDAASAGNEARFMNDYRGVQEGPNAEFRECWVAVGNGMAERRIVVFVLEAGKLGKRAKGIAKGMEILVSYGKGFWTMRSESAGVQ